MVDGIPMGLSYEDLKEVGALKVPRSAERTRPVVVHPSLLSTLRVTDDPTMAKCPYVGCTKPISFGCRALSRDGAVLEAFGPFFDTAMERWPDKIPDEFSGFVDMGKELSVRVHSRAHAIDWARYSAQHVKEWRAAAVDAAETLAINDLEWFYQYWGSLSDRGLRPPARICQVMTMILRARDKSRAGGSIGDPVNGFYDVSEEQLPVGVGWSEGLTLADIHDGTFGGAPEGVVFYPQGRKGTCYPFSYLSAEVVTTSAVESALKAHASTTGLSDDGVLPEEMIVASVAGVTARDYLLSIVPTEDCTVNDWVAFFRSAGVSVESAHTP